MGRAALGIVLAWLITAALLVAAFWPSLPHTAVGWLAFVVFGPLLYFTAEATSEFAWSSRAGRAISHHPSSVVRIIGGVAVVLVVGGISLAVSWFIVRH